METQDIEFPVPAVNDRFPREDDLAIRLNRDSFGGVLGIGPERESRVSVELEFGDSVEIKGRVQSAIWIEARDHDRPVASRELVARNDNLAVRLQSHISGYLARAGERDEGLAVEIKARIG